MNKRDDIVQKFSTFLSFGDHKAIWQADAQLERRMKYLVESDPEAKAEFWARHFLTIFRNLSQEGCQEFTEFDNKKLYNYTDSITTTRSKALEIPSLIIARHLSAYLQEACLWAAQKSYHKYKFIRYKYPVEEYFQMASSFAHLPAKLLKNFNLEHPRSNIEGYARTVLFRLIRDQLYQQDLEVKREKFSDYGLLRVLNAKELKESLLSYGIQQSKLDLYQIVWQYFNEIYPDHKEGYNCNLELDNPEILRQIAESYNQRINQLNLSEKVAQEDTIQEMLAICIKAARNYRTKQFIPLEEYDNISDLNPTPLEIVIQQEETQQIQLIISKLFANLPEVGQIILILWQGLELTQSEIATVVKSQYTDLQKQYQVARHLARYTKTLLKEFVIEWNQVNPSQAIQDEQSLEIIKAALDECLQLHCQQLVTSILQNAIHGMNEGNQLLVFTSKINNISDDISRVKQTLINRFIFNLEVELNLNKDTLFLAKNKISNFVEEVLISIKH
ncbi:sigma-70 family RNA polymerase sigma factor [Planktothrix mougeotii]|uniref:Sigma-70 family RNA polymerase sigma factor n=1 Tax=Planktothrix mougeotii LEGE 06226 TaxID=1828728 RepID=A0ABR9UCV1_9CYAN|nr:sigma-70 family RNA polymerase sigma factor [Planktothrix mougeotii]MBE9144285.1 sigma-70 family RNA polymerase sigma factor [Planktothrix mougeotii LEGE 06226]